MYRSYFPVSGVVVSPLIPFLAAFGISIFTSMGGISGSFVLLPFQVSILGFISPAVTPTNHLFNVLAIPSGVYRYIREGRMVWPLTLLILLGTAPGVILGSWIRLRFLPDPNHFKLFMGLVLLFIGSRLARKVWGSRKDAAASAFQAGEFRVRTLHLGLRQMSYEFEGQVYCISTPPLVLLAAAIGTIGGTYGVGGGAIISPFLVSLFHLPVHSIAGATLSGTCLTSFIGVIFFTLAQPLLGIPRVAPDWLLGGLLALGGTFGMYCGARLQRRAPARTIESILALVVVSIALSYIVGFFRR